MGKGVRMKNKERRFKKVIIFESITSGLFPLDLLIWILCLFLMNIPTAYYFNPSGEDIGFMIPLLVSGIVTYTITKVLEYYIFRKVYWVEENEK